MNEQEFSKMLSQLNENLSDLRDMLRGDGKSAVENTSSKAGMEEIILRKGNGENCFSTGPFDPKQLLDTQKQIEKEDKGGQQVKRLSIRNLLLEYQLLDHGTVHEITRFRYQENGDKKVLAHVYLIVFADTPETISMSDIVRATNISTVFFTNNRKILESIQENLPGKKPGNQVDITFPPMEAEAECPEYLFYLKAKHYDTIQPLVSASLTFRTRRGKILSTGAIPLHCDFNQYSAIDRIFRKDAFPYEFDDDWFEVEQDAYKVAFSIKETLMDLRLYRVKIAIMDLRSDRVKDSPTYAKDNRVKYEHFAACEVDYSRESIDKFVELQEEKARTAPKRIELDARTAIEDTGVKIEPPMFSAVINKVLQKLPELQIMKVSVRGYPNFYVARETVTSETLKMKKDILWLASSTALLREPGHTFTMLNISGTNPAEKRSWIYRFIREYDRDSKTVTYTANTTSDSHDKIVPDPDITVYHDWWDKAVATPGIAGCSAIRALEELYMAFICLSEEKNREYVKFIGKIGKRQTNHEAAKKSHVAIVDTLTGKSFNVNDESGMAPDITLTISGAYYFRLQELPKNRIFEIHSWKDGDEYTRRVSVMKTDRAIFFSDSAPLLYGMLDQYKCDEFLGIGALMDVPVSIRQFRHLVEITKFKEDGDSYFYISAYGFDRVGREYVTRVDKINGSDQLKEVFRQLSNKEVGEFYPSILRSVDTIYDFYAHSIHNEHPDAFKTWLDEIVKKK